MKAFTFVRPTTVEEAAKALWQLAGKGAAWDGSVVIKAGGIDLLDRMKERIDEPDRVVTLGDLKDPALREIREAPRRLSIGALVTLAQLAESDAVRKSCPALAEAAASAASPQIRARATVGGNLCQHTRCGYYRIRSFPCFKRGDDACPVREVGGVQDTAGIFDNTLCASAHPSSLSPVLGACGATVLKHGSGGEGESPFENLHTERPARRYRADVGLENTSWPPIILAVILPRIAERRAVYEEVRQKSAFDWALVSCCVRVDMEGDKARDAGVWLGSVARIPWHAEAAEKALVGKPLTDETIAAAAEAAVAGATPLPGNAYKVDLVKVVVRRALERLRAMK